MSSTICFNLDQYKILSSGIGLISVTYKITRDVILVERTHRLEDQRLLVDIIDEHCNIQFVEIDSIAYHIKIFK